MLKVLYAPWDSYSAENVYDSQGLTDYETMDGAQIVPIPGTSWSPQLGCNHIVEANWKHFRELECEYITIVSGPLGASLAFMSGDFIAHHGVDIPSGSTGHDIMVACRNKMFDYGYDDLYHAICGVIEMEYTGCIDVDLAADLIGGCEECSCMTF